MANKSNMYFDDDLKDLEDQTPYDSISGRDPLESIGLDKFQDASPDASGDDTESDDDSISSAPIAAAPTSAPSTAVKNRIAQKFSGNDFTNDPLMKNFNDSQQQMQALMQAKRGADAVGNMGQAFSQIAQGANTPKPSNELYQNIARQNEGMVSADEKQADLKQKVIQAIEQRKGREQVAANNLSLRSMLFKQHSDDLNARTQEKNDAKATDKQTTAYNNAVKLAEQLRGSPAVSQAERDLYAADKANSLINLYGDPDKLSNSQVKLLVSELGKIASGGVPTEHELEGITPGALVGVLSESYGKLVNHPTAANAGAFVKQYQDYANALTKDAQKTITDRYGRIANSIKSQASPEQFKAFNDTYINRFGANENQSQPSTKEPAPNAGKLVHYKGKLYRLGDDGNTLNEVM